MRIVTAPEYLIEGLFGHMLLHIFQILSHLHRRGIFPDCAIRSRLYRLDGADAVIPGGFELAYRVEHRPGGGRMCGARPCVAGMCARSARLGRR